MLAYWAAKCWLYHRRPQRKTSNPAASGREYRHFSAGKKMAHNGVGQMGFIKGVGPIYAAGREGDVKRMSWKREVVR
ncbi:hypothetical protein IBA8401_30950 [Pseudomonas syringae]